METLYAAVEAVSELYDGRPLKWREWRHLLTSVGDKLSNNELQCLESHLSHSGQISMRTVLEVASEQMERSGATRRLVQWTLDSGQRDKLVDSGFEQRGFAIVSIPSPGASAATTWPQLPAMQCTRHVLDVSGSETACRLQLSMDHDVDSCLQLPLFLLHGENDLHRPVCVARWDAAVSECRIDVVLSPGRYTLTSLLLPQFPSPPPSYCPSLFSIEPDSRRVQLTATYKRALRRVHGALDWQCRGSLSRRQFSVLNEMTSGEQVRDAEWSIVLEQFDTTEDGRLTLEGLEQLHRLEAEDLVAESDQVKNRTAGSEQRCKTETEDFASRPDQLWQALHTLGFDYQLQPVGMSSYRLKLYSDLPDSVRLLTEDTQLASLSSAEVVGQLRQLCAAGDSPDRGWRRLLLDSHLLVLYANVDGVSSHGGNVAVWASVVHNAASNCYAMLPGRISVPPGCCALVQCLVRKDCRSPWKPVISVFSSV